MGIVSRFHTRKLQLIMKAYRSRYERKLARIMEDDDLISEYAPSELSDRIAQEDAESDDDYDTEGSDDEEAEDTEGSRGVQDQRRAEAAEELDKEYPDGDHLRGRRSQLPHDRRHRPHRLRASSGGGAKGGVLI